MHLCRVIYIQKNSSSGIPKDSFSKNFQKSFLDGVLFKEFIGLKQDSYMGEAAFFYVFLTPTLRIIQSFLIPLSLLTVITRLPQHKKDRKGKEKVIK